MSPETYYPPNGTFRSKSHGNSS